LLESLAALYGIVDDVGEVLDRGLRLQGGSNIAAQLAKDIL